ncbi:PepSY-associated TM helix domain-containing protein [Bergeyella sp. RCAD1439]|uniref:PepSY-associated TM helix domain-containing protein n=1 Tax=Bergeyella anatis TaxID=3113737 RepID=UPI002E186E79|nr:PepSY-associated TM helix domain-containing protein [Bergeyella sp. RCAD1439]
MKKITRVSFRWHRYFGLFFGILYLFFGLSGALLVFKKEIEKMGSSRTYCGMTKTHTPSLDEMYRKVFRAYPQARQFMLGTSLKDACEAYEFTVFTYQREVAESYLYCCVLDSHTGEVLREGNFNSWGAPFFRWLYSAHYSLLMDKPGRLITAVVALAFFLNLVTGVIIYRKKFFSVLCFKEKINRKSPQAFYSSLHRLVGVWTLAFNFILFFTGFWMNKGLFLPQEWALPPRVSQGMLVGANIDGVVQDALAIPGFSPIAVRIPSEPGKALVVSGQFSDTVNPLYWGKGSEVYYDGATGRRLKIIRIEQKPFSERFYWMMKQLHRGDYESLWIKGLYVFAGLSPAFLSLTGFYLWKKKRAYKR